MVLHPGVDLGAAGVEAGQRRVHADECLAIGVRLHVGAGLCGEVLVLGAQPVANRIHDTKAVVVAPRAATPFAIARTQPLISRTR